MPAALSLSPEARLVFRSADPSATPEELQALARAVVDWERSCLLAEREGATGSLWRALQPQAGAAGVATEFLRSRTMLNDFRMQHLAQRAQHTVRALVTNGIPVTLLKGAAIGAMADPTFRTRPMTDLDILIQPEDAERTRRVVIEAGWPETEDPRLLKLLAGQHHLPPFLDAQVQGLRLEVHTALLPRDHSFRFASDDVWRDARPAPAPFEGALVMSPTHMFLHTCMHFAWQHQMRFGAWRTWRSLAAIVAQPTWSWDELARAALEARAGSTCYWTLRLGQGMAGLAVPAPVLTALAPPTPAWLMRAVERHMVAGIATGEGPASPSARLSQLLWRTALRPKWSGHHEDRRYDPDHEWERAFGQSEESALARMRRHASGYRDWWAFVTRTLVGR